MTACWWLERPGGRGRGRPALAAAGRPADGAEPAPGGADAADAAGAPDHRIPTPPGTETTTRTVNPIACLDDNVPGHHI